MGLDLFVQFEGISGNVSFRNASSLPQGMAENATSDPCSVWTELGEPVAEPTRWSLWDQYTFGKDHKFIATIIHETSGDVEPGQIWRSPSKTLETISSSSCWGCL